MSNSVTQSSEYQKVAEQIGVFIEYWGFKKVHGKVWTLIFLSPQPVDANFIKETLKISKALTSMTIKDLLSYKVILEVAKDKPGTQKYCSNPDLSFAVLEVLRRRELKMLEDILTACRQLSSIATTQSDYVDSTKVSQLCSMVEMAHSSLSEMTSGIQINSQALLDLMNLSEQR